MILLVVGALALMAAVLGFLLRRPPLLRTLRIPAAITGAVLIVGTLLSPTATPESGLANPMPLTVESAAAGEGIFQASCAACHGVDARGGGTAASTTAVRPPALTGPEGHLAQHSDGDLHYWIGNGLAGGMPAWGTRLSSDQIWHLVNYLRSINGAPFVSLPPSAGPAASTP